MSPALFHLQQARTGGYAENRVGHTIYGSELIRSEVVVSTIGTTGEGSTTMRSPVMR